MPFRLRVITAVAATSLALVPTASADWHDQAGGPDPSYPGWNDPSGGTSWSNPNDGGSDWTNGQPEPQQAPQNWTPPPAPQGGNPWSDIPALPVSKTPTVRGKVAMIRRNGLAAVPKGAPARVRAIITAANQIIGKPYKWGGGHGRLFDTGYDCSGSVSYALIRSGLLGYPMVSGSLAHWGAKGKGEYVTIYANRGHVYMEVAGLRLDTSSVGDPAGKSGVRWRPPIGKRFGFAVRHIAGL